jgi:hypothetical protein
MKMTVNPKKIVLLTLWSSVYILRKFFSLDFLVGTKFVFITPLLASFLSLPQTIGMLGALSLIKFGFGALPITLGLPTMLATLSWSTINRKSGTLYILGDAFLHLIVPTMCIALFVTHPVAGHAWPYATFWFIPMIMWALRNLAGWSGSFWIALQSTFMAHALGSIMYLFTVPMTAATWLGLIPVVVVERLTMASTSCLLYESGLLVLTWIKKPVQKLVSRIISA